MGRPLVAQAAIKKVSTVTFVVRGPRRDRLERSGYPFMINNLPEPSVSYKRIHLDAVRNIIRVNNVGLSSDLYIAGIYFQTTI